MGRGLGDEHDGISWDLVNLEPALSASHKYLRQVELSLGTNVVSLQFGGVLVLLIGESDCEGLSDDLRFARPVRRRVHVQAFEEAAVFVA